MLRYLYMAAVPAWEDLQGRAVLELEVLKAADLFQAEGLLKHCLEAFRSGLTVHTAIEHLVWAHKHGPEEARRLAMAYVVQHIRAIQVMDPLTRNGHALLPALLPCPESSGRCSYEMFFLPVDGVTLAVMIIAN